MKRVWLMWTAFFVSVALVLVAMGWSSWVVLELERAEKRARQQAALEELVRLALWRMDSTLTPVVTQASVRPNVAYYAPLPLDRSPWVHLYFQFGSDGSLTSPQVPKVAGGGRTKPGDPREPTGLLARRRLDSLRSLTTREELLQSLPRKAAMAGIAQAARQPSMNPSPTSEFSRRAQIVSQNAMAMVQNQAVTSSLTAPSAAPDSVLMSPVWTGDQLLLARRIVVDGQECVQGCLLDWPAIRRSLLDDIKDLLPEATLQPATDVPPTTETRILAALPVRLIPGPLPEAVDPVLGPAALSLAAAWAAMLLAAGSVAVLLAGVMRLSARRAAFVSAVTHELRTPLTTFQLYSEMLAEGMVPEAEGQTYLRTLRSEAQRLTHLVENVLAYARLEHGRSAGNVEQLFAADLLGPIQTRLADVAARAGMQLVVEAEPGALATVVRVNRSSLEQILMNLVDNAAKYAAAGPDKRVHLAAALKDGHLELRVWDHGPGLSPQALRRLFRPFARPAQEAAGSAPGVGVGLAISRRLARDMDSRLELDRQFSGGACFVLMLPEVVLGDRTRTL